MTFFTLFFKIHFFLPSLQFNLNHNVCNVYLAYYKYQTILLYCYFDHIMYKKFKRTILHRWCTFFFFFYFFHSFLKCVYDNKINYLPEKRNKKNSK